MKRSMILAGFVAAAFGPPAFATDLSKVDRRITKEPAYQTKPWYGLLVFGPEAKSRVWLILDGNSLYLDRDANGDLTQSGERLQFQSLGDGELTDRAAAYGAIDERGMTHEIRELRQANAGQPDEPVSFLIMLRIGGRYTQRAEIEFADRPERAPVYHFDGPLQMIAYPDVQQLAQGQSPGVAVASIGTPGLGNGPAPPMVMIYSREFPKDVHPVVEIVFPPAQAGAASPNLKVELDDRC
jgi:hypothetical protein